MQFQQKLEDFEKQGVTIIGISYDEVSVLTSFAEKYNITYPLLADVNSSVIKSFGILKSDIDLAEKSYGIPYPGLYRIDENLVVIGKHFEKSYAARPSAEAVLITEFGQKANAGVVRFEKFYMTGSVALSDTTSYPAQILVLKIDINMKDGFHLYGRPIPDGYIPFTISMEENENFAVDEFMFPERQRFEIEAIDDTFFILPDEFSVQTFIRTKKNPELGQHILTIKVEFQACNDNLCMPPAEMEFKLPITVSRSLE